MNARPTTQFIVPYLTAVGELAQEAGRVDVNVAWQQLCAARVQAQILIRRTAKSALRQGESVASPDQTVNGLTASVIGWLSLNQDAFRFEDGTSPGQRTRLRFLLTPTTS